MGALAIALPILLSLYCHDVFRASVGLYCWNQEVPESAFELRQHSLLPRLIRFFAQYVTRSPGSDDPNGLFFGAPTWLVAREKFVPSIYTGTATYLWFSGTTPWREYIQ